MKTIRAQEKNGSFSIAGGAFHISLKYSNLGITRVKITEILLEDLFEFCEIPKKIGEILMKNCEICRLL